MPINASALAPTPQEHLARGIGDLRMGLPCAVKLGAEETIVAAVETLSQARYELLFEIFGAPELVLSHHRARTILTQATSDLGTSPVRIRPPERADVAWFRNLADPASDLARGPLGPLHLLREGDTRLQVCAVQMAKAAQLLPAVLLFSRSPGKTLPDGLELNPVNLEDIQVEAAQLPAIASVAAAGFPLEAAGFGQLHVFRDPTGTSEHFALEIGTPDRSLPVLARLHSACFTGDVLGSLKCDCGPQLHAALARMGREGAGVLLYLNQEGRGIGLANKMRVYDLQAQGFDTVEANHRLGFDDEERDFRVAAVMLRSLGFGAARLLTNNPAKVKVFSAGGITITEELPLQVGRNIHNTGYLTTKAVKSGHAL